ncbi:hypothetical protein CCZ01_03095 [Helicobacter monodelphidis]|uniref:MATE family efflux transporter n=1 Tax=Helicobacter sp. 15-1451 TaxID=2004995 RepID=UPI000DCDB689|nr:MATE family efflux transporter [Helicobacter sp. 15-1451]RAX58418.1 hypothetical protein CCZ01_03095 [Helicobacter sp. 15-1451]
MTLTQHARLKKILRIAVPAALQSMLDLVSMFVSFIFIGSLGGAAISALGASVTYFMYIYAITTIFNVGTNACVSRKIGMKDYQSASEITSSMLFCSLIVSIFVFLLAFFTYSPFFLLLRDISNEAKELGREYLSFVIYIIPFFIAKIVIVAAMSASGDTQTPFRVKILATLLSILLNYLLIQGNFGFPALGLKGAGIANLIVNIAETLVLVAILFSARYPLSWLYFFSKEQIWAALKIGFPSGLERLFTITSMAILTLIVAGYGEEAFAGYMIGSRVESFVFMPCFGLMIAAMSLMGQNLGAKREAEAKRCIKMILWLGMSFMGTLGIVLIVAPIFVSRPFNDDIRILEYSALYLFYIGFSQIPLAMIFILDGALRGAGATKVTLIVNSCSIWGIRILSASVIGYFGVSIEMIYLVMSLETFLRAGVYWFLFQKGIWRDSLKQPLKA